MFKVKLLNVKKNRIVAFLCACLVFIGSTALPFSVSADVSDVLGGSGMSPSVSIDENVRYDFGVTGRNLAIGGIYTDSNVVSNYPTDEYVIDDVVYNRTKFFESLGSIEVSDSVYAVQFTIYDSGSSYSNPYGCVRGYNMAVVNESFLDNYSSPDSVYFYGSESNSSGMSYTFVSGGNTDVLHILGEFSVGWNTQIAPSSAAVFQNYSQSGYVIYSTYSATSYLSFLYDEVLRILMNVEDVNEHVAVVRSDVERIYNSVDTVETKLANLATYVSGVSSQIEELKTLQSGCNQILENYLSDLVLQVNDLLTNSDIQTQDISDLLDKVNALFDEAVEQGKSVDSIVSTLASLSTVLSNGITSLTNSNSAQLGVLNQLQTFNSSIATIIQTYLPSIESLLTSLYGDNETIIELLTTIKNNSGTVIDRFFTVQALLESKLDDIYNVLQGLLSQGVANGSDIDSLVEKITSIDDMLSFRLEHYYHLWTVTNGSLEDVRDLLEFIKDLSGSSYTTLTHVYGEVAGMSKDLASISADVSAILEILQKISDIDYGDNGSSDLNNAGSVTGGFNGSIGQLPEFEFGISGFISDAFDRYFNDYIDYGKLDGSVPMMILDRLKNGPLVTDYLVMAFLLAFVGFVLYGKR